jgi:hypothetical protein
VEVSTPPARSLADLEREYLNNLRLALRAARPLGLRLYPLGAYPLPFDPAMRDGLDYEMQVRVVGPERFMHAGRCAGMHLHLESGISAGAPESASGGARPPQPGDGPRPGTGLPDALVPIL